MFGVQLVLLRLLGSAGTRRPPPFEAQGKRVGARYKCLPCARASRHHSLPSHVDIMELNLFFAMLGGLPVLAFVANRVVRFTGVPDVIVLMTGSFAHEATPIG